MLQNYVSPKIRLSQSVCYYFHLDTCFRTDDYFYYYLRLKAAFLRQMEEFYPEVAPPCPVPRAEHLDWQSHADQFLLERDHLVQVAEISIG